MPVTSPHPRLSLCMIVRDEANDIEACLASVRGLVDEMIVVDTGSVDDTAERARAAGARVEHVAWTDDFSAARNASVGFASSPWILVLDADERLTKQSFETIRQAMMRDDFVCGLLRLHDAEKTDASEAQILSGAARMGEMMSVPRLLKRTDDLAYEGIVHESLRPWLLRHGNKSMMLDADIVHYGAVPSVRMARGKGQRNTDLLEKRLEQEPGDFTVHGYLAHEMLAAGEEDRAWRTIEKGWELVRGATPGSLRSALRLAAARALVQFKRGDARGALDTATVGLNYEGFQPDLSFFAGRAHEMLFHEAKSLEQARDHLDKAQKAYEGCLATRGHDLAQRYVKGVSSWASTTRLATVLLLKGDAETALRHFDAALRDNPSLDEASMGRAEALIETGHADRALQALEPLLTQRGAQRADAWLLAALATDALGQLDDFKTFLAQARSHSSAGYPSPRHNQLHGTLHGQLLAYMGQPTAGKGVIGTACACMCGEPPEGETSMNPIQRRRLRSFVRNLLLSGQSPLVDPLLDPRSESALPGLKKIITDVVQSLGMSIEEQ